MANLLKLKKIKQLSLNLYTDIQVKLDLGMGNTRAGDGGPVHRTRAYPNLQEKQIIQRYGKLAGLVKEELKDPLNHLV